MKLTWFGGNTFRLHIGGAIVVIGAQNAPAHIDRNELLGGADHSVELGTNLPLADGAHWKRRPAQRLLDAGDGERPVELWSLGAGNLLIDADGEAPIALFSEAAGEMGRWAEKAVLVIFGNALAARAEAALELGSPRLIALGGSEADVEAAFAALRDKLDGTGLVALEPGLAVEV